MALGRKEAMQESKKHHFLPQSYLKRFSSENDELFILNKQFNKVNPQPKSTSQICYQENLHTVYVRGMKALLIEEILSKFESKFSLFVDFIEQYDANVLTECLHNQDYVNTIKMMLAIQFWRNPKSSELTKEIAENLMEVFDSAYELNIKTLSMSRKDLKYIYKKRNNIQIQKIIQFFLLPLITIHLDGKFPKSWRVCSVGLRDNKKFITSDNPIYTEIFNVETCSFDGEFAFPITENIILTNLGCDNESQFNFIQSKLFENANKLVISSSKATLDDFLIGV